MNQNTTYNMSSAKHEDLNRGLYEELCNIFSQSVVDTLNSKSAEQGIDLTNIADKPKLAMDVLHELLGTGADFIELQMINNLSRKFNISGKSFKTIAELIDFMEEP